jgi:nucleotide-binding universal stress UspA family protein
MFQKILFPVDFSPSCVAMAAYVERAAAIFGAEVSIIYVCDLNSYNGFELYVRPGDEISQEHWNLARSKLELFLSSEFPAEKCPRILLDGDAASVIAETATKGKFDLIMMPTHAGRFRRMLLGSTTAKVVNDADCPVLTMQHSPIAAPRSLEHRSWVCAIGLHSDSERLLRYAKDAALAAGAKLSVVHAIRFTQPEPDPQRKSEEEQKARQRIAELQSTVGSDAAVCLVVGDVKEALLDVARRLSADVLVIGRRPQAEGLGRMRDLTYSLLRDSPCPVVSV